MANVLTEIEKDMFSILWFGVIKRWWWCGEGETGENDIVCVFYMWILWKNYKITFLLLFVKANLTGTEHFALI